MLGLKPISWSSKKQRIVDLSSRKVEYVATSYAACQTLWFETLLEELNVSNCEKVKLLMDNQLAIDLENHPMNHGRSKHIKKRYHCLMD